MPDLSNWIVQPTDFNDRTDSRADEYPYDRPTTYGVPSLASVWEQIEEVLDYTEMGPQAASAAPLGYGNHGRMGEDGLDALELEMDALKTDFRQSYEDARPSTDSMRSTDLFGLLMQLDPEFGAETFAPEDEEEMRGIYGLWADKMSGCEE